jgi:hypothetical protein
MLRRDRGDNLVRCSWTKHGEYAERYAPASTDQSNHQMTFRRLRSNVASPAVERFSAGLARRERQAWGLC